MAQLFSMFLADIASITSPLSTFNTVAVKNNTTFKKPSAINVNLFKTIKIRQLQSIQSGFVNLDNFLTLNSGKTDCRIISSYSSLPFNIIVQNKYIFCFNRLETGQSTYSIFQLDHIKIASKCSVICSIAYGLLDLADGFYVCKKMGESQVAIYSSASGSKESQLDEFEFV